MSFIDPKFELPDADETARLRRIIKMQLAVIVSLVLHVAVLVALALIPLERRAEIIAKVDPAASYEPPVPITFLPPQPRETSPPTPQSPPRLSPPDKPLRMQAKPDRQVADPKPRPLLDDDRPTKEDAPVTQFSGAEVAKGAPAPSPTMSAGSGSGSDFRRRESSIRDKLQLFREAMRDGASNTREGAPTGQTHFDGRQFAPPGLPARPPSYGQLTFESADYDWTDYARVLSGALLRALWKRDMMEMPRYRRWCVENKTWSIDLPTRVRFTIHRDGTINGVVLEQGCEAPPMNEATVEAIKEVIAPPLPRDFPRDEETLTWAWIVGTDIPTYEAFLKLLDTYNVLGEPQRP